MMKWARWIMLLLVLGGCGQLYSKDTIVVAGPELCGERWQILEILLMVRKETLIKDSRVKLERVQLELTGSKSERTISVLISWPEGFSCVIASGGYIIRKTESARNCDE